MRLTDIALPGALTLAALLVCLQNSEATTGIKKHIYGGQNAVKGQFPMMARFFVPNSEGKVTKCGGSIIGTTWILTAAHCYFGYLPKKAFFGGIYWYGVKADLVVDQFKRFIKHDHYVPYSVIKYNDPRNDIALLELLAELPWTDNIHPVKLPRRSQATLPVGTEIIAAGFGSVYEGSVWPSYILNYLDMSIIDDAYCTRALGLCTFDEKRGLQKGDSGGPWIWKDESGVEYLVGVAAATTGNVSSGGITCLATDVHSYLDWIGDITGIQIDD